MVAERPPKPRYAGKSRGSAWPTAALSVHRLLRRRAKRAGPRCTGPMRELPATKTFDRRAAHAAGWTDAALRHAVRTGRIVRLRHGIMAAGPTDNHSDPIDLAVLGAFAAARACRGSVISHQSAAVIHGLPLLFRAPTRPTITVPPDGTGDLAVAHLHRASLPEQDIVYANDVAVTSVARTVVDIARSLPTTAAVITADAALQRGLTTDVEVEAVMQRCRNWPGVARARTAMPTCDARAESPLESFSRLTLAKVGLPAAELQLPISDGLGRQLARVDFYWEEFGVVGEADGHGKYQLSPNALVDEKLRQERLEDLGLVVVRWGWSDVGQGSQLDRRVSAAFERGSARDRSGFPRMWSLAPTNSGDLWGKASAVTANPS